MRSIIKGVIAKVRAIEESAIQVKKGAFHAWLGKSPDQKITAADIAKGKAAGGHAAKMAEFAQNFGHIGEATEELNDRVLAAKHGLMHPDMAKHMKVGHDVDFYSRENGNKLYGKVTHASANSVRIQAAHTGKIHKFKVGRHFNVNEASLDEAEIDYTRSHPDTDDKAIWYKHARMRGANRFVTTSDGHHKAYKVHDEHDDKHVGTWDIHHEMGWIHEETIDEAHKVIDNHQDEHGNRFEVHAHNQGHSSEWHAIMKTHQGGEKVHAVIATGKPAYIRGQMKTIKARKYTPLRTEETLDEGKRRESKMEPIKHKGKTIGHIWKNAHGEHEAEHTKTGMSWASDDKNDLISQVKDQHDSMREETLDEISPATAKSYIYKSVSSQHKLKVRARNAPIIADPDDPRAMEKAWDKHDRLMKKVALRRKGLRRATDTLLRAKAKGAHIDEETLDEATKYFTDAAEWHKHAQVHGHVVFKTGGPTKTQGPTLGAYSKTGEHRGTFVYDKKGHGGKGWQFTPYHEVKEETISENDTKCNAFGHRPFKGTCLDCGAPVSQSTRPGYSAVAVDKAIKSSRKKISGREAKLIHRLLRGRH